MRVAAPAIRPAAPGDLGRVVAVEREAFTEPWSPAAFRALVDRERALFLVAEEEGAGVVGHGVLWWQADEAELASLAVAPSARRRGVASRLLDALLEGAREAGMTRVFLEVRASNAAALALYRRRGFREVGRRADYYRRPREDARVLRLDLRVPSPSTPSPSRGP